MIHRGGEPLHLVRRCAQRRIHLDHVVPGAADADDESGLEQPLLHLACEPVGRRSCRGVELVTLSACESASVSVDRYGNAEGLPLAFLRAGVSTVVGTLWEIETTCSRAFFELFYTALARNPSRQEAFRSALAETRRRFPDPHDWSAFFLVGDWR